jgi:hypothetical protein
MTVPAEFKDCSWCPACNYIHAWWDTCYTPTVERETEVSILTSEGWEDFPIPIGMLETGFFAYRLLLRENPTMGGTV